MNAAAQSLDGLEAALRDAAERELAPVARAAPAVKAVWSGSTFADPHLERVLALKRRWRELARVLEPLERDGLKLAPALLICSFDQRGLKSDAPGVEGVRSGPRFPALARRLGLPAPAAHQAGPRLVGALLVLHDESVARVLVQPAESISTHLVARVAERCVAANELYARCKVPVRFELVRPGSLDPSTLGRLAALGGCLSGRPAKWLTDAMAKVEVTAQMRFTWVPHGPTALCRVQLLLDGEPRLSAQPADPFATMATLRIELSRALKATPLFDRPLFRAQLKRELLPGRIPTCLLPALRAALPEVTRKKAPSLQAGVSGRGVALRLPDGSVFASGRTLLQARVRAMLLAQALWGFVPDPWLTGPQWKKLQQRLSSERSRATSLFALGPEGTALALALKGGREPRMRELDAGATLRAVLSASAAGHVVEVVACSQAQELEAMHLSQLAWRAAAAAKAAEPVAVHQGEHVLLLERGRFHRFRAEVFHRRPRRAVLLDATPPSRSSAALGNTIECDATLDGSSALVSYRGRNVSFRERVELDVLSSHLQGAMRICAATPERTLFMLNLDDGLQKLLDARRTQSTPSTSLEVRGDLVRGLQVVVAEQTFGPRETRAAAETILSAWPVGVRGQLDVRSVHVGVMGAHASAVHRLYARAVIARRLSAHIDALVGLNGR